MTTETPKRYNIKTDWIKHIKDPKQREEFRGYVVNSRPLLERLIDILEERIKNSEPKKTDYEQGSWPYYMADTIGYQRALKEVIRLVDITERGNDHAG